MFKNDDELHGWIKRELGLDIPRRGICAGHVGPFEYLRRAYFEPAGDLVVWAPRGGGKTRLAAAATLLDLLHKPGCQVRILGGSLEQSLRVWEHLAPDLERLAADELGGKLKSRSARLLSGANAAVLTQSQRAVRGQRVQKLRCDEVELFDPDVWEAAQLITRSISGAAGTVEAISTWHAVGGLMGKVVESAQARGTPVLRWCLLEVLGRCECERDCATCALHEDCGGAAKDRCEGFVSIDDALRLKSRVSRESWQAEMLCQRPSRRDAVFPTFERDRHVREFESPRASELTLAIDFGFANAFVCLWVGVRGGDTLVIDEYVHARRTLEAHLREMEARPWGKVRQISCDPAGSGPNDQTAESNVQLLRRAGYAVRTRKSLIVEGLELIRRDLCSGDGQTHLFIHPRCVKLIAALENYRYAEKGGENPLKDGVHDHLIDALRYYYVNRNRGKMTGRVY